MAYLAKRSAWRSTVELYRSTLKIFDEELRLKCGLSSCDFEVLVRLWTAPHQRMHVGPLAEAVITTRADMARKILDLEHEGLVMRVGDSRELGDLIEMTPHGKRRFADAERIHAESIRVYFTDFLSEPEARTMTRLHEKIRARASLLATGGSDS